MYIVELSFSCLFVCIWVMFIRIHMLAVHLVHVDRDRDERAPRRRAKKQHKKLKTALNPRLNSQPCWCSMLGHTRDWQTTREINTIYISLGNISPNTCSHSSGSRLALLAFSMYVIKIAFQTNTIQFVRRVYR